MVVFIHLFNDRSGSPKVLSQTIRFLFSAGCAVETITSSHPDGFLNDVPGVRRNVFYRRSENKILTLFFFLISQIYLFFYCFRYWRQDVVFHVNTMMPFGAALSAFLMRKKVVYHIHETSIKPELLKNILRFFIKLTADHVIFVSNYLKDKEGFFGKSQVVIYNSIDTPPCVVDRADLVSSSAPFNVLMVCSLKRYKGVDEFVEIAHRLAHDERYSFTLVLNAEQYEIDAYFSGRSLGNLSIFSRQSDLSAFYRDASLLLSLSRPDECIETYGLTIVEAMAYSLPVIVPPVGGPAELVEHGQQGFQASCYDCSEIVNYIQLLSSDSDLYARFSNSAYHRAMDFLPEFYERNIIQFYREKVL